MLLNTNRFFNRFPIIIVFIIQFFIPLKSHSQDWLGINTSNYGGINNVFSQPASIADNRFKVDVNLVSFNFSLGNNFIAFDPALLKSFDINSTSVHEIAYNGKSKYFFLTLDLVGPSAMITLSPKHAFGIFSRGRVMFNLDDIDDSLIRNINNEFNDPNFWQHRHNDDNISLQIHAWTEYGLSYARIIYDKNKHFLKGGINAKILKGFGSAYLFVKDFDFSLKNQDYISVFKTDMYYGHSNNINFSIDGKSNVNYTLAPGYSVGFDFGLVYEYRPKYKEFKHDLDGKPKVPFKNKNKYLLKVGISVTDIGSIKYTKSPLTSDFHVDIRDMNFDTYKNIKSINEFDSISRSLYTYNSADSNSTYKMGLPTALSLQIDYHLYAGFYFNFTPTFSLKSGSKDVNKTHYFSMYTLTPRWENKWFGVYNPITYDKVTGISLGLGLRLGPIILGTSNLLLPYLANKEFTGMNVYCIMKVPIPYAKRKDLDNDGVSDKKDLCINLPGTWESKGCPDIDSDGVSDFYDECPRIKGLSKFNGCPDSDLDGIPDNRDQCPYDSGTIINFGCPDIDGDGVIDINDSCPDLKGSSKYNGCPDIDGDGTIDIKDSCPNVIGLFQYNGCPDTDGDGVYDKIDECPEHVGLKQFKGCPDIDNDFVPDKLDHCPNIPGLIKYSGCPDTDGDGVLDSADACINEPGLAIFKGCPDRDMDGIPDKIDKCPDTYGLAENQGCPLVKVEEKEQIAKLTVEEQAIVKTAFNDLEFETGKSVILSKSFASLDSLAVVLIKKPEFKLLISGHTDNVGKPAINKKLSENRALAVKAYLVKKLIAPDRILTYGYGSQRPIAPNNTVEGKQKNRRVEFKIIN